MRTSAIWSMVALAATAAGCSYEYCEYLPCGVVDGGAGADGGGGQGGEGGGGMGGAGGDGGSGGGLPPGCTPAEGELIGADCGVFVQVGQSGTGSQTSPFGTVQDAVAGLNGATAIYVCGGDSFAGSLDLPGNVSVFGGLDCTEWRYAAANPTPELRGAPNLPAVTISGAGTGTLQSLRIVAEPANAPGASSIALLLNASTTTVRAAELTAASGAPGAAGAAQAKAPTPAAANGGNGMAGCMSNPGTLGGGGGQNTCQATSTEGGSGGQGTNSAMLGGDAADGLPFGALGQGGTGEFGNPTTVPCTTGGIGAQGLAGTPGLGATSTDQGTLETSGYLPPNAPPGLTSGVFGQGGGGGGGANQCGASGAGPSGGGGGAGGCGGSPGNGGQGGGGSFALISINASVTLDNVTLTAANGGVGGAGDAGQPGMDGGIEGTQGSGGGACPGGPGGNGGQGGAGGGGRGGPSVGIASVGDAPTEVGTVTVTIAAAAAAGGLGGNGGGANIGGNGAAGILELRQAW